jgi:Tfp pilus assembly protein PilN
MIRINLIGLKTKAKSTTPKVPVFLFVGLLVAEAAFLFVWHQKLSSELDEAQRRTRDAQTKIDDLNRVRIAWEQWQAAKVDLDRQNEVFESLKADQKGPAALLQYFSYILTQIPDSPSHAEEIRAQELVGWNPRWNPRRVWIRALRETGGTGDAQRRLAIEGDAVDHQDVAEFYRRLETSGFFPTVEPGLQTRKFHQDMGLKFIDFNAQMTLSYLAAVDPDDTLPPADAGEGSPSDSAPTPAPSVIPSTGPGSPPAVPGGPGRPAASIGPGNGDTSLAFTATSGMGR